MDRAHSGGISLDLHHGWRGYDDPKGLFLYHVVYVLMDFLNGLQKSSNKLANKISSVKEQLTGMVVIKIRLRLS